MTLREFVVVDAFALVAVRVEASGVSVDDRHALVLVGAGDGHARGVDNHCGAIRKFFFKSFPWALALNKVVRH